MSISEHMLDTHEARALVLRICREWADADMGNEPFWEDFPECPSEQTLTPNMVLAALMGHHDKSNV